jgi:hypothetical protein
MKFQKRRLFLCLGIIAATAQTDAVPLIDSWFTKDSGKYARIYQTTQDQMAGRSHTTWSQGDGIQNLPAYNGVQEIYSSANWVYIRSSGLAIHTMGPWYFDPWKTQLFRNAPANTKTFYRFPRHATEPPNKTLTTLGVIGYFVDGVAMYDSRDAVAWTGSEEGRGGEGYWNRDAYVNESPSFDPSNAHQDQSATYHYHANPPGLRNLLGDNVLFDTTTKTYKENSANPNPKHSPILGWVRDGFPIYGPYGFSKPDDAHSKVRRMISGYTLRNGQDGADDLAATGRGTLPAWAVRVYNVSANQAGPNVCDQYPLGRYMEDHAYLGDLEKKQGVDFDLDECNGRFCVTPEFPNGTYAYFVSIDPNGTPIFPYNIGRAFHGDPTGSEVSVLSEVVVTVTPSVKSADNTVTLVWNSIEGGKYEVDSSPDASHWTATATNVTSQGLNTKVRLKGDSAISYRVVRTSVAGYDPVDNGSGIASITPAFGKRGNSVTVTIRLSARSKPRPPPSRAPINEVTIGALAATDLQHVNQQEVTATIDIPSNAPTGPQTVTVEFAGPPFDPGRTVTYTLPDGFKID